jgi:hypothetical protein
MPSVAVLVSPFLGEERILPMQWADGGHGLLDQIPEVRLHQAVVTDAVWVLAKYRHAKPDPAIPPGLPPLPIREVIEWLRDPDGERATFAITFHQAMAIGFPRLNAEVVGRRLLSYAGYGPRVRFEMPKITRRHLVRGLPASVVRSHVRRFRPQVGRGRRVPPEEESLWPSHIHAS